MPHPYKLCLILYFFLCHLSCVCKLHEHTSHLSAASFQFKSLWNSLLFFRIVNIESDDIFVMLCFSNERLTTVEVANHLEETWLNFEKTHSLGVCFADGHFIVIFQICFIDLSHWLHLLILDAVSQNEKPHEGGISWEKTTDHFHAALSFSPNSFPLLLEVLLFLFFTLFLHLPSHLALCWSRWSGRVNFLQIHIVQCHLQTLQIPVSIIAVSTRFW